MICSLTRGCVDPKNLPKYENWIKGPWIKLISEQRGHRGTYYLSKPNGEWMVLKFWETTQDDEAWAANEEHKKLAEDIIPLFFGDLERSIFEVNEFVIPDNR